MMSGSHGQERVPLSSVREPRGRSSWNAVDDCGASESMRPSCSMKSALHVALLAIVAALSACAHAVPVPATIHKSRIAAGRTSRPSSKANAKPSASQPPYAARTATLEVTGGLKVAGVVSLPANFVPDLSRAPIWLEGG